MLYFAALSKALCFIAHVLITISIARCWAKNYHKERDAPDQILFGAMDWRYNVLSLLGVYLEHHAELCPGNNEFVFDIDLANDPDSIKDSAAYHLKRFLASHDVQDACATTLGDTGTHSIRKFAVNQARGAGCSKDDTDCRGRWRNSQRQQETYANTTIPYVDGKVAAALCKGGPIMYEVKEPSGVTSQWILDHVTRHMVESGFPTQVCLVLGRAVLWKVFAAAHDDEGSEHCVPAGLGSRVLAAYEDIGDRCTLRRGENPVARLPLGVTGVDSQLIVDVIMTDGDGDADGGRNCVSAGVKREEMGLLLLQVIHL